MVCSDCVGQPRTEADMTGETKDKKPTPAYVPFRTFLNALDTLQHGVPSIIDRTVWPTFSGLYQSQTLGAFRFLGLIDADGKPTPDLQKLVEDKDNRQLHLRKVLERSYASLVKKDLTKMTPASFNTAVEEYGATGDTHRKVVSFFLQASKYAGLPLSPYILKQARTVHVPRKRRAQNSDPGGRYVPEIRGIADNQGQQPTGPTKTIELDRGVTLTLATSADTFAMATEDRAFVMKILGEIEDYEAQIKLRPEES